VQQSRQAVQHGRPLVPCIHAKGYATVIWAIRFTRSESHADVVASAAACVRLSSRTCHASPVSIAGNQPCNCPSMYIGLQRPAPRPEPNCTAHCTAPPETCQLRHCKTQVRAITAIATTACRHHATGVAQPARMLVACRSSCNTGQNKRAHVFCAYDMPCTGNGHTASCEHMQGIIVYSAVAW
jgi:hypothetical protein